ncbi:MAG: GtrA family protein [Methylococcales bacterium]|nr:GtrA family protein [Methylococcales bacterium]
MKKRRKPKYKQTRRSDRRAGPGRKVVQPANRQPGSSRSSVKLIARFIGVGLLNTLVGYAIYGILIFLNVPYLAALLMATIAGVIFNYFSIGRLVFKSPGGLIVFAKFIAAYGVVYSINATALDVLIKHFQFNAYIGQALCIPLSVIISWLLMNYWVYKND